MVSMSKARDTDDFHSRFFKSPDGKQTWIVYHATSNANGACDGNRYTMAGLVNFTSAGPVFGNPPNLATVLSGPSGEP
jgi:GH43 family beta-xylosidase